MPGRRTLHQFRLQSMPDGSVQDDSAIRENTKRSCFLGRYAYGQNSAELAKKNRRLLISDEAEVERFYFASFKDMLQSHYKVICKAFVKFVELKKQSHYPYTKGDNSRHSMVARYERRPGCPTQRA
jgi:hypothetical protein